MVVRGGRAEPLTCAGPTIVRFAPFFPIGIARILCRGIMQLIPGLGNSLVGWSFDRSWRVERLDLPYRKIQAEHEETTRRAKGGRSQGGRCKQVPDRGDSVSVARRLN